MPTPPWMQCSRTHSKDAAGSASPCCLHFSSYAWTSHVHCSRLWPKHGPGAEHRHLTDKWQHRQSTLLQGLPPASNVLHAWLRCMPQEWLTADQVAELTSAPVSVMCASKDVASRRMRKWGSRVSKPSRIRSASCRTSTRRKCVMENGIMTGFTVHMKLQSSKQKRGFSQPRKLRSASSRTSTQNVNVLWKHSCFHCVYEAAKQQAEEGLQSAQKAQVLSLQNIHTRCKYHMGI